jgi:hypothetical protein
MVTFCGFCELTKETFKVAGLVTPTGAAKLILQELECIALFLIMPRTIALARL